MKHFPFLLDEEVCRCGIKLFTSWEPNLCGSLGCGLFIKQATTLKDVISRGVSEACSGKLLFRRVSGGTHKSRP